MGIMFATCDVHTGLKFINKTYPNCEDLTEQDVPKFCELLRKDIIRVQDPALHYPPQIVAGTNYDDKYKDEVQEAVRELMSHPKINS